MHALGGLSSSSSHALAPRPNNSRVPPQVCCRPQAAPSCVEPALAHERTPPQLSTLRPVPLPQQVQQPKIQRPVVNSALAGRVSELLQQGACGRADEALWRAIMHVSTLQELQDVTDFLGRARLLRPAAVVALFVQLGKLVTRFTRQQQQMGVAAARLAHAAAADTANQAKMARRRARQQAAAAQAAALQLQEAQAQQRQQVQQRLYEQGYSCSSSGGSSSGDEGDAEADAAGGASAHEQGPQQQARTTPPMQQQRPAGITASAWKRRKQKQRQTLKKQAALLLTPRPALEAHLLSQRLARHSSLMQQLLQLVRHIQPSALSPMQLDLLPFWLAKLQVQEPQLVRAIQRTAKQQLKQQVVDYAGDEARQQQTASAVVTGWPAPRTQIRLLWSLAAEAAAARGSRSSSAAGQGSRLAIAAAGGRGRSSSSSSSLSPDSSSGGRGGVPSRGSTPPSQQPAVSADPTRSPVTGRRQQLQRQLRRPTAPSAAQQQQHDTRAAAPVVPALAAPLTNNSSSSGGGGGPPAIDVSYVRAWLEASPASLASFSSSQLASSVYSLALLKQRPPPAWQSAFLQASQAVLHTASAQDLANTLWALATLDLQPTQQWWAAFQVAVSAQLWGLSGAGTANLLWAAGKLQLQPQAQLGALLLWQAQRTLPAMDVQLVCSMVWGVAQLQLQPKPVWLSRVCTRVSALYRRLTPSHTAGLLLSLSALGYRSSSWLARTLGVMQPQLRAFSPLDISATLLALARMRHTPHPEWLFEFTLEARRAAPRMNKAQLLMAAQSMALLSANNTTWRVAPELLAAVLARAKVLLGVSSSSSSGGGSTAAASGGGGGGGGGGAPASSGGSDTAAAAAAAAGSAQLPAQPSLPPSAAARYGAFSPADCANLAQSLVHMQVAPGPGLMAALTAAFLADSSAAPAAPAASAAAGCDVAVMLWALGAWWRGNAECLWLRHHAGVIAALVAASGAHLAAYTPLQLKRVLVALASMGFNPGHEWLAAHEAAVAAALPQLWPKNLEQVLRGYRDLGYCPAAQAALLEALAAKQQQQAAAGGEQRRVT